MCTHMKREFFWNTQLFLSIDYIIHYLNYFPSPATQFLHLSNKLWFLRQNPFSSSALRQSLTQFSHFRKEWSVAPKVRSPYMQISGNYLLSRLVNKPNEQATLNYKKQPFQVLPSFDGLVHSHQKNSARAGNVDTLAVLDTQHSLSQPITVWTMGQ